MLTSSVGRKGVNRPTDVKCVQKIMNFQNRNNSSIAKLKVDGLCGDNSPVLST